MYNAKLVLENVRGLLKCQFCLAVQGNGYRLCVLVRLLTSGFLEDHSLAIKKNTTNIFRLEKQTQVVTSNPVPTSFSTIQNSSSVSLLLFKENLTSPSSLATCGSGLPKSLSETFSSGKKKSLAPSLSRTGVSSVYKNISNTIMFFF